MTSAKPSEAGLNGIERGHSLSVLPSSVDPMIGELMLASRSLLFSGDEDYKELCLVECDSLCSLLIPPVTGGSD